MYSRHLQLCLKNGLPTHAGPDLLEELEQTWPQASEEQCSFRQLLFDSTNEALEASQQMVSFCCPRYEPCCCGFRSPWHKAARSLKLSATCVSCCKHSSLLLVVRLSKPEEPLAGG